jgi:DNA helicase IV
MDQIEKEKIITEAREHLGKVQESVVREMKSIEESVARSTEELKELDSESEEIRIVQSGLIEHGKTRLGQLDKLKPSPYFTRCDVLFGDEEGEKSVYFGKFSFEKEGIVSWATPIAGVRFEEPGPISYVTPEDGLREGTLLRKDQYMIVDGKILFLASESDSYARQLVYQEYLSARSKMGFALPEIVAQMEKAQDQVIRAHHAGPFVISGPAGSGKTTLALHRVAYLTQSPDTAKQYPGQNILVFVQDTGTQDYFSHLLPELGIHDVKIVTFSQWAFEMLKMEGMTFGSRIGEGESERDLYEYAKLQALRAKSGVRYTKTEPFSYLRKVYDSFLDEDQKRLLSNQEKDQVLDRYDLTLLLGAATAKEGFFTYEREMSFRLKNGNMKRQKQVVPVEYSLVVVDEFQNYMPEQLHIFKQHVRKANRAVLYVGDLAQQTQFGTINDWNQINEAIHPERTVKLHKVYRNTKNILEYIRGLGFSVEIPDGLKSGVDVKEIRADSEGEIKYVTELQKTYPGLTIGVLAKDASYLLPHNRILGSLEGVRCMSIREAQGVEFDIVCLVGVGKDTFAVEPEERYGSDYLLERKKINKDLLYVALTRAVSQLHVLGEADLSESVASCL